MQEENHESPEQSVDLSFDETSPDTNYTEIKHSDNPSRLHVILHMKKSVLLIVLLLLLALSTLLLALLTKIDKANNSNDLSASGQVSTTEESETGDTIAYTKDLNIASKFVPDYSDMRAYIELGDEQWYATFSSIIITSNNTDGYRIITTQDIDSDITSFTDLVNVGDKVWAAGQGGIVRIDGSSYTPYLNGKKNIELAVDPDTNKLYAGTFESGFYEFDEQNDMFILAGDKENPTRVSEIAFTEKYVVMLEPNDGVIRLLDKDDGSWSTVDAEKFTNTTGQRSYIHLLQVENQVLVYGRHADYTGCGSQGSYPATVAYQIVGDKTEERESLTKLFEINEARQYDAIGSTLMGDNSCGDATDAFYVNMSVDDGKIVSGPSQVLPDYSLSSDFADQIAQLEAKIKFPQTIALNQFVNNSSFSIWQSDNAYSLYQASGLNPTNNLIKKYTVNNSYPPIVTTVQCSDESFVINTTGSEIGYNRPYLLSIDLINQDNSTTELFTTNNQQLYEGVSAQFSVGSSEALCADGTLVFLGENSEIATYTIDKGLFTVEPVESFSTGISLTRADHTSAMFKFIDIKNEAYKTLNIATMEFLSIPLDSADTAIISLDGDAGINQLLSISNDHIVLSKTTYKDNDSVLTTYNPNNGSLLQQSRLRNIHAGQEFNTNSFILQYDDGETKIVNATDHKSIKTISKPGSIIDDKNFNIKKKIDTKFFVTDTDIWFSSAHWGLIAYDL